MGFVLFVQERDFSGLSDGKCGNEEEDSHIASMMGVMWGVCAAL
jgi:hypothetical protein